MDWNEAREMYLVSERRTGAGQSSKHRFVYDRIPWDKRLIGLVGPRGAGKTTMMLQRIGEKLGKAGEALYISLDNLWFASHDLRGLVDFHYAKGGRWLFIDEVHYCEKWQTLLKNLYDDYPELHIVYSGSSLLKICQNQGDLSRRQLVYNLPGLSFREYLDFENKGLMKPVILNDILEKHSAFAQDVAGRLPVQRLFSEYLSCGYYPFYKEDRDNYAQRIRQTVSQVLECDYPAIDDAAPQTVRKARKMLMILAENPPQTPNVSALCQELETDRKQGLKMLYALERAGLLALLGSDSLSLKNLSRPEKIYCDNPNLMQALVPEANLGSLRECFFVNQTRQVHQVSYPAKGDFLLDGKFLFEVGGRRKSFDQIKDIQDSYLVVDDLEVGFGNRIPLWCFGFLY